MKHVLCSKVTNGKLAENNLRSCLVDSIKLVEDDLPLGIDNGLVFRDLFNTDLRIIPLALQLQLDVQTDNSGLLEVLGLLLKAGIGEGLLKSDAIDEERVLESTTGNLLHTDQLFIKVVLIQRKYSIHNHYNTVSLAIDANLI